MADWTRVQRAAQAALLTKSKIENGERHMWRAPRLMEFEWYRKGFSPETTEWSLNDIEDAIMGKISTKPFLFFTKCPTTALFFSGEHEKHQSTNGQELVQVDMEKLRAQVSGVSIFDFSVAGPLLDRLSKRAAKRAHRQKLVLVAGQVPVDTVTFWFCTNGMAKRLNRPYETFMAQENLGRELEKDSWMDTDAVERVWMEYDNFRWEEKKEQARTARAPHRAKPTASQKTRPIPGVIKR